MARGPGGLHWGVGVRGALGGHKGRREKPGESEPVNAGPKGNGQPLKDAPWGGDMIPFVGFFFFSFFERSVGCKALAARNKSKQVFLGEAATGHLDGCEPFMLQLSYPGRSPV